jgi:hypothetical protein
MGCASGGAEASPEGEPERRSTRVRGAGARRARALSSSAVTGEEECMARFVNAQVPEVVQPVWAALQRGEFIADAAVAGTYRKQGTRWVAAYGGVRPRRGRNLKGRCLTFAEREEIAPRGRAARRSARSPGGCGARRRRSRVSCAATPTGATVAIGRQQRTRWPTSAPVA